MFQWHYIIPMDLRKISIDTVRDEQDFPTEWRRSKARGRSFCTNNARPKSCKASLLSIFSAVSVRPAMVRKPCVKINMSTAVICRAVVRICDISDASSRMNVGFEPSCGNTALAAALFCPIFHQGRQHSVKISQCRKETSIRRRYSTYSSRHVHFVGVLLFIIDDGEAHWSRFSHWSSA
jgi:hypothetical protein